VCKKSSLPPLAPSLSDSIKIFGLASVVDYKCNYCEGVPVPRPTKPSLP
jgi:hypothetical protein